MNKQDLKFKEILELTKQVLKEKDFTEKPKGGRPRKYDDTLVIAIYVYQQIANLSFRKVLKKVKNEFGKAPYLSVYYYRISILPESLLNSIVEEVKSLLKKKT